MRVSGMPEQTKREEIRDTRGSKYETENQQEWPLPREESSWE